MNNERNKVSIRDIMNDRANKLPESKRAALPRDFIDYRPKLYKNLFVPSYVHGYSLAIEYMTKWITSKFPKDYFKFTHINGKHVLSDWKNFNNYTIKREKPMLAVIPTVEYDYDRDNVDLYQADPSLLLKQSKDQQSFFKDYDHMSFLYMRTKVMRMDFSFKIRENTKSRQIDTYNRMMLWCRVGSTQHTKISADFHIPYEIMVNIANTAGFIILDDKIQDKDIEDFLSYMNKFSELPIIYKIRAINQKYEFFVRVNDLYTHISCRDQLQLNDGERIGKLDDNFDVELNAILTIPIPQFYAYMNQIPLIQTIPIKETENPIPYYSINAFEIPPVNDIGWMQKAVLHFMCDKDEEYIDLKQNLYGDINRPLCKAIKYTKDRFISPTVFIDVQVYYSDDVAKIVKGGMNYDTFKYVFDKPLDKDRMIDVVVYADNDYMNDTVIKIDGINDNRIKDMKQF